MPPVGFEPTISASQRPQTYALDRAATGNGNYKIILLEIYRVIINYSPDYKHLLQKKNLYVAPQLEEFQPWIIFQQDGAPPHWGLKGSSVFGCNISKQVHWDRRSDTLATTIAGYHYP